MALSELQQVNAIVGLSKNIEGWPSTLADHKYSLDRIELKFKVRDPQQAGHSIVINPDLLFVSDTRNCSLIVELKSGTFHEHDLQQMDNLVRLKPIELVRSAGVTLQNVSHVSSHKISTMIVVNQEHLAGFSVAFASAKHKACLVSISEELIQSKHGDLTDNRLDREFKDGINIEMSFMPTRLITVLPTTNETYEVIRSIVDTVRNLWVSNERFVTPQRIAAKLFDDVWELFDSEAQQQFVKLAGKTLKDMRETEFNRYLAAVPEKSNEWRLLKLPETEGKNITTALKTFAKATREYKWRRQHGIEYRGSRHLDQMTFKGFNPDDTEDIET